MFNTSMGSFDQVTFQLNYAITARSLVCKTGVVGVAWNANCPIRLIIPRTSMCVSSPGSTSCWLMGRIDVSTQVEMSLECSTGIWCV